MKRVAICMRGAISRMNSKFISIDEYNRLGDYIDYQKCYNSIVRHIIQPNEKNYSFDFICHCWNEELQDEVINLYAPVKYTFESNTRYTDEISGKVIIPTIFENKPICSNENSESIILQDLLKNIDGDLFSRIKFTDDYSGISQALTMKKSIELKEAYEAETKIEYDIVILYRYDVLLWKDIILDKYIDLDKKIYVNGHYLHGDANGDFHFIMNPVNASKFKHLYDSACNGNKHQIHAWIKNYVNNYLYLDLIMDDIIPGTHQEVYRKLHELSIDKGYLTLEQLNSYVHI